ncbi:MAG TPA: hypothetical protein ENF47_04620 [Thermoprotei archaeon]|nr:hypothetical protein [Thermoprotei archaeon]
MIYVSSNSNYINSVRILSKENIFIIIRSLSIYIPIFGYFAFAMFFLAGIGILRIIWLPIIELSPEILKVGHVAILPFIILHSAVSSQYLYAFSIFIAILLIASGLFLFSIGVVTWLYGKLMGLNIIDFWIYRFIRHPQYLGFIIWSYGLLILIYF